MNTPSSPRLVEITPDNVLTACKVKVRQGQNRFVAPVERSLAEAYADRESAWPRLIMDGDEAVGFVMADFAPDESEPDFRCGIWRLNIAEGRQRRGYGGFAVRAVCEEARHRGNDRITVMWVPGEGGPEDFYPALGFRPTGRVLEGEKVGELLLGQDPRPGLEGLPYPPVSGRIGARCGEDPGEHAPWSETAQGRIRGPFLVRPLARRGGVPAGTPPRLQ